MLAEQSLREGDPVAALEQLQDAVRKDPSNTDYRVFLFQLLSVLGQWDRALNQLKVAGEMDPKTLAMVQAYREAVQCEVFRADVFAGRRSPVVFGEPDQWLALLMEATRLLADGKVEQAAELRGEAFEGAPTTSGTVDGAAFEWIADADVRLGPVLEVIVNGRYWWVPFQRIRSISIEEPEDLRDFVWTPTQLVWANGGQAVGLIPTRYPGSEASEDGLVRLARKTDWGEAGEETWLALGQRMLATDAGEFPLMDVRQIDLDTGEEPGEGEPTAADDPVSESSDA